MIDLIPQARGDVKHLPLGHPSAPVIAGEKAGWPRQNRAASAGNSVLLPANARGSAGVMRMDQVGSGARQALQPHRSVCGAFSSKRLELGQSGWPLQHPPGALRTFPAPGPLLLLGGLSSLLGPPGSSGGGG